MLIYGVDTMALMLRMGKYYNALYARNFALADALWQEINALEQKMESYYVPLVFQSHRAEVYSYTMPHTLIDTDGQFNLSAMDHVSELMADQMKLGIPTVYNGKLLRQNRFFMPAVYRELNEEDYAIISRAFKIQRKNNGLK
jgi:hypothetical protein